MRETSLFSRNRPITCSEYFTPSDIIIRNNVMWRLKPGVSPPCCHGQNHNRSNQRWAVKQNNAEQCKPVRRDIHQSHFSWVSGNFFHIKEVVYKTKYKNKIYVCLTLSSLTRGTLILTPPPQLLSPCTLLKATEMGRFLGITVKKLVPCWCLDGQLKEPCEISMAVGAQPYM